MKQICVHFQIQFCCGILLWQFLLRQYHLLRCLKYLCVFSIKIYTQEYEDNKLVMCVLRRCM